MKLFFKHETESYPASLSCNSCIRSTTKSALLPVLEKHGPPIYQPPVADTYVIDGSALIQMLKPEEYITTFEEYILNIVTPYVLTKATFYKRIDIVFDVYLEKRIKGSTRDKRSIGYRVEVSKQAFLPSQCSWSKFLRNGENKSKLFQMIADAIISSISANIATIVVTSLDVALSNTDLLDVQSLTALFRAFSSHRQSSASLSKLFPSCFFLLQNYEKTNRTQHVTLFPSWTRLLAELDKP